MIHARSRCRSQGLTGQFNTGRFAGWLPDPTPQPAPADGPANDATSSWILMGFPGGISAILPAKPREIRVAGRIVMVRLGGANGTTLFGFESTSNQWSAWYLLPWAGIPNTEIFVGACDHYVVTMRVEFR